MPITTASPSSTEVLDKYKNTSSEHDESNSATEAALEEQCYHIQKECLDILSNGVNRQFLTQHDRTSFMAGVSFAALEAGGAKTMDQKLDWLKGMEEHAKRFVAEAEQMGSDFLHKIENAEKNKWLSRSSAHGWKDRLFKRSGDWPATREFLNSFDDNFINNWKVLHTDSLIIKDRMKNLNVTGKQVSILKEFEKADFEDKGYYEKRNVVNKALAALKLRENDNKIEKELYKRATNMLKDAKDTGAMSTTKDGKWMVSLFNQNRSVLEIKQILDGELSQYISKWKKTRFEFDEITIEMDKTEVPPGFKKYTPKEFLNLDYFKRESYVMEAKYAMRMNVNGLGDRPIDGLKLDIRMEMAQKQWSNAKRILAEAWNLAEADDKYELSSMQNYIEQFSSEDEEDEGPEKSALEIVEGMREMLAEVPSSVRQLYIDALNMGPKVFKGLYSETYNLIWCYEHGYLNQSKDEELYQASFAETEEIVENGHWDQGLENINLSAVSDSKKDEAMRPYENTWAPTLIHLDANDGGARAAFLNRCGENRRRNYWETVKLRNISYDKQQYLVYNVNWKLRGGIEKLYSMGHAFSLTGDPPSIN